MQDLIKNQNYRDITGKRLVHASTKKFIVGQKDTTSVRDLLIYLSLMGE